MLNFQKNCNGSDNFGNNAKYQVLSYQLNNQTGSQLRVSLSGDQAAQITLELIAKQGKVLNKQTFYVGSTIKSVRFDAEQKAIVFDIIDAYGHNTTFSCDITAVIEALQTGLGNGLTQVKQLLLQDIDEKFAQESVAIDSEIEQLTSKANQAISDLEAYIDEAQHTIETGLANKPGKVTEDGGIIFNDQQNNKASAIYATAFGRETTALTQASFASNIQTIAGVKGFKFTEAELESAENGVYKYNLILDQASLDYLKDNFGENWAYNGIISIAIPTAQNGSWAPGINNAELSLQLSPSDENEASSYSCVLQLTQPWYNSQVQSRLAYTFYLSDQTKYPEYCYKYGPYDIAFGSFVSGWGSKAIGHASTANGVNTTARGDYSYAEGYQTKAIGGQTHAQGNQAQAIGHSSHAQNINTRAIGIASHAQGRRTQAEGLSAHAQGTQTVASGQNSHTQGYRTTASGRNATATGDTTTASGDASAAFGVRTRATGLGAVAEGLGDANTGASGQYAHTQGYYTTASARAAHAQGARTEAAHNYSHAAGRWTKTGRSEQFVMGTYNQIDDQALLVVGCGTTEANRKNAATISATEAKFAGKVYAAGKELLDATAVEAYVNTQVDTAMQEVQDTYATKDALSKHYVTAGRLADTAAGGQSTAQGLRTTASATAAHAEGVDTKAIGGASHAEGKQTEARGTYTHAEGHGSIAEGSRAHAQGYYTKAIGADAHAEGQSTEALGAQSHAQGLKTIATGKYQHVEGRYNIEDSAEIFAHIVGNGAASTRSNAHTLDWSGNAWYAGNITANKDVIATNVDGNNVSLLGFYQDVWGRFQEQSAQADNRNNSLLAKIQQNTTDIYNINTGLNLVADRTTALQEKTAELQAEIPRILTTKNEVSGSSSNSLNLEINAPNDWSVAYCTLQLQYVSIDGSQVEEPVCVLTNNSTNPDLLTTMTFDSPWGEGSGTYSFKLENASYTLQNTQKYAAIVSYSAPIVQLYGTSYTIASHEEALLNSNEGLALGITRGGTTISAKLTIKWL